MRTQEERERNAIINKERAKQDSERLNGLYIKLRKMITTNEFAKECWQYYIDNYCGQNYKNDTFNCRYLESCLDAIENKQYS